MSKKLLTQVFSQLMIISLAVLLVFLPSVNADGLMQGTVSGKMFFFLYVMLMAGAILLLKIVFDFPTHIRFGKIDGLLLLWIIYMLLNGFFQQMPLSSRLLELAGLIVLYFALRQIQPRQYPILLIAMIIGGAVQAVYGNLQLWGYYPSHHSLFRITGSFFNPGPYAGYLASVFPAVLGIYLFRVHPFPPIDSKLNRAINKLGHRITSNFKPVKFSITDLIVGIALMAILMILLVSRSRAAWMSVGISSSMILMVRYPVVQWLKNHSWARRGVIVCLLCVMVGAGMYGLFRFNTGSANGRFLVWKVTGTMIAGHPITGVGFDRFKAFYMNEQARYFEQDMESPEAMVAGDVNYAFNEFLQHTAENGITGLILMLAVLVYAFRVTNSSFCNLTWTAKAGIAGIVVFALFSYPAQVLPIKISLVVYLACLASLAKQKTWQIPVGKHIPAQCVLAISTVIGLTAGIRYLNTSRSAWENWNSAYWSYMMNDYVGSLPHYEKAWPVLKTDGDYLANYGKALSMAGEHQRAVSVLQQAALYYPSIIVYTALGDSYKALGKSAGAEQSYWQAWYMNPSRFYPKYLLAKLYDETGQAEKATAVARELLNKEVKIKSSAINEIRKEMEQILRKYQDTLDLNCKNGSPRKGRKAIL